MSKVLVIIGSTRPSRAADLVVPWVTARARAHEGFDVEVAAELCRLVEPLAEPDREHLRSTVAEIIASCRTPRPYHC